MELDRTPLSTTVADVSRRQRLVGHVVCLVWTLEATTACSSSAASARGVDWRSTGATGMFIVS